MWLVAGRRYAVSIFNPEYLTYQNVSQIGIWAEKNTHIVKHCYWRGLHGWLFFSMDLPAHSGLRPLIQYSNHFSQTIGLLGLVISPSQGLYLKKNKTHTRTPTSMPWVGFKSTIHGECSCLRPRGYCDWYTMVIGMLINIMLVIFSRLNPSVFTANVLQPSPLAVCRSGSSFDRDTTVTLATAYVRKVTNTRRTFISRQTLSHSFLCKECESLRFILLTVITKQFTEAVGNNKRSGISSTFAARKEISALHVGTVWVCFAEWVEDVQWNVDKRDSIPSKGSTFS
jgi:hypothetical protein